MSEESRGQRWLGYCACLFLVAAGAYLLNDAWGAYRLTRASVMSTCTSGGYSLRENDSKSAHAYAMTVRLVHEAGGRRFEAEDSFGVDDQWTADRTYKEGARFPCYHVPGRPDLVAIWPKSSGAWAPTLVIGAFLALAGPAILAYPHLAARRRPRRKRRRKPRPPGA